MTALAMRGDRERCLEAGMSDYVSKPIRPQELQRALERVATTGRGPAPAADALPLDTGVLANLRLLQDPGEPDFVGELIDHFLADMPPRLAALARAAEKGDARELERLAHSLKSSAANLGVMGVSALAGHLEERASGGSLDQAGHTVNRLREVFASVRPMLEAAKGTG